MKIPKFALALALVSVASVAVGQKLSGTLKKIQETGAITVGYRESSIPFGYLDDKQQPIGYGVDVCMKIVDAVRTELKMPSLKVNMQPITSSNRIPLLQNGTIDIECGSTTNSVERQQQVSFGPTYFIINISAAVKKSSNINSITELDGKNISTTSGTTAVAQLKKLEKLKNVNFREIYGKDHSEAFLLLADDRTAAFIMDDILLAGQIASARNPGDYKILQEVLRAEPYAPMFRKDDPEFKAFVERTMVAMMRSGEMERIYNKWFTSPIPPKGINLNFPISPLLREAFQNPNDKGVQ